MSTTKGPAVFWDEVFECINNIRETEPSVYFMDGHQMSGKEGWKAALTKVYSELSKLASKSPTNTIIIKELPWMCGECATRSVRSLELGENQELIAKCDKCGTEWIT